LSDRKAFMERVIRFLLVRTEEVSNIQGSLLDPRFEQNITNHLTLVEKITDKLLRLEGQIGMHEFVARRIIEKFFFELAPLLRQAAEDTYGPDRLKAFMERVAKTPAKIDMARIKQEAAAEAAAFASEEAVDAIQSAIRTNAG